MLMDIVQGFEPNTNENCNIFLMEILREEKDQSGVGDGIIFRQLDFHPLHGDKTFPPDIRNRKESNAQCY